MEQRVLAAAVMLLAGCVGGGPQRAAADDAPRASVVIDLFKYDIPLVLQLGDPSTLGVGAPTVQWSEEFGHLRVDAGDHFGLLVTEGPGDLARLKSDLARDMLRVHTVIEESADRLIYRSEFPDDAGTYIHFHRSVQVGGRHFVVTDVDDKRFDEADVRRMIGAIANREPA